MEISFLIGLPLSSGITEAILASSENTPYIRILFIAIERGVLNISAESFPNLGGILSKPVAFLVSIFLRRFSTSTRLVGSKLRNISLGVFDV